MNRAGRKRQARKKKQQLKKAQAAAKTVISRSAAARQRSDSSARSESRIKRSGGTSKKAENGTTNTVSELSPKTDLAKNRTVYATVNSDGKTEFLPAESDASDSEKKRGLFIKDSAIEKLRPDSVSKKLTSDPPKYDLAKGRKVYGSERVNADGDTVKEFLPRKSDATQTEIDSGFFVDDALIKANAADGTPNKLNNSKRPKYDLGKGRTVYPTTFVNADGQSVTQYFPRESEASNSERADGLFVKDNDADDFDDQRAIAAEFKVNADDPEYQKLRDARAKKRAGFNRKSSDSKADLGRSRRVYPAEVEPGVIKYLPLKSETTPQELRLGLFVEDVDFPDQNAKDAQGRQDVSKAPIDTADDGTELWTSSDLPELDSSTERDILSKLKPRYDLGFQRMIYPTETGPNKVEYLPLREDATREELARGIYITFAPDQPVAQFLRENAPAQEFNIGGEVLKAHRQEDVDAAFDRVEAFVLRSQNYQKELLENNPAIQQEWVVPRDEPEAELDQVEEDVEEEDQEIIQDVEQDVEDVIAEDLPEQREAELEVEQAEESDLEEEDQPE